VWHSTDIEGRRIHTDGTLEPIVVVSGAAGDQSDAAIGWDGQQYVALYEDLRSASSPIDLRSDVFGTRVGSDGTVFDAAGFAVMDDPLSEILPAVDGLGGEAFLMASDFRESTPYLSYRVAYRLLSEVVTGPEPAGPPAVFALGGGTPNPFASSTRLTLEVPAAQDIVVEVFDAVGRRVALLQDGTLAAGRHALVLDGAGLPSGVYVVRAAASAGVITRSVVVAR
jgi:hypothetical protein